MLFLASSSDTVGSNHLIWTCHFLCLMALTHSAAVIPFRLVMTASYSPSAFPIHKFFQLQHLPFVFLNTIQLHNSLCLPEEWSAIVTNHRHSLTNPLHLDETFPQGLLRVHPPLLCLIWQRLQYGFNIRVAVTPWWMIVRLVVAAGLYEAVVLCGCCVFCNCEVVWVCVGEGVYTYEF